eukprot:TRINITY_DN1051_c0_g1_i6.p1 TRINITY_DN1051_c0_g1~~TRINITY_DN1051_c0_g1_i6.p1  ORF type:complete len:307 (+),score=55.16 TRINITY_DN1051_c0_g1_i6:83-1003(+)
MFHCPDNITVDSDNNIIVADRGNHRIRKVTLQQGTGAHTVTTVAGSGSHGFADGTNTNSQFNCPYGVAVDKFGQLFVGDCQNHRLRKITPQGKVSTVAGTGVRGFADGGASSAQFCCPTGVALDNTGNIFVADSGNHRIRRVSSQGVVTTLAGSGINGYSDGGASSAKFSWPSCVAVASTGIVFVGDNTNNCVRRITPQGDVGTLAGCGGRSGFADGDATQSRFNCIYAITIDADDTLFVADHFNCRIRKVSPNGVVTTVAGSGARGDMDGQCSNCEMGCPAGVAVDRVGNIFFSDGSYHKIRRIS